jgi:hypothetical protein
MNDLHNDVKYSRALSPAAAGTDNTPHVSEILDTANFGINELVIMIGANTDANATFTVLLEEGDESNLSDNSAVADADMLGTEALASFDYSDDNETRKLGYIGAKRYIRATITPAGNDSGNIYLAAVWAQAGARKSPIA